MINQILKIIGITIFYGIIWFMIFSIPVGNTPMYAFLLKQFKTESDSSDSEKKDGIKKEEVIDALEKAFK